MSNQLYHYSGLVMTTESTCLNTQTEIEAFLKKYCSKYVFQLERGEKEGKLHYQIYLNLTDKKRLATLAKLFQAETNLPIRLAPSSVAGKSALARYCMKTETRVQGPWADRNIYMGEDLPVELFTWQKNIFKMLGTKPDSRKVYWFVDAKGGKGKSTFSKYMYFYHDIVTITFGNAGDLLHLVSKFQGRAGYIFDLSRTKGGQSSMNDIYASIEAVKNGYFINTKYECSICCFAIPHVIVFSNHYPEMSKLSKDRWEIIDMSNF